jgi:hypothetical protein
MIAWVEVRRENTAYNAHNAHLRMRHTRIGLLIGLMSNVEALESSREAAPKFDQLLPGPWWRAMCIEPFEVTSIDMLKDEVRSFLAVIPNMGERAETSHNMWGTIVVVVAKCFMSSAFFHEAAVVIFADVLLLH